MLVQTYIGVSINYCILFSSVQGFFSSLVISEYLQYLNQTAGTALVL